MTEPERPAARPAGNPTPEEISARLEALLKRTHTLRAQRAVPGASGGPLGMTWPPPDRELDGYDVVDVDEGHTSPSSDNAAPSATVVAARTIGGEPDRAASEFARPDWGELRLRTAGDDRGSRSSWLWVLTTVLALATVGQAAYIWYLQTTRPAPLSGRIRVDGPDGAEVRVDGQAIGIAPVDHALEPGGYTIEVVQPHATFKANGVVVGLGRTVVLLVPAPTTATQTAASGAPQPGGVTGTTASPAPRAPAPGAVPAAAAAAATGPTVSPTMGAVVIETVPAGLPVTMGGRPRGVTPITIGMIRPGRHDVMVGSALRQVDIKANEVSTLRVP